MSGLAVVGWSFLAHAQSPAAQDHTRQSQSAKTTQTAKPLDESVKKIDKKKKKTTHVTPVKKPVGARPAGK
jgi:hypothetical protein